MNTLKPLNCFFESIRNDQRISSTHIGIFAALLQFRAEKGFVNPIQAFSHEIMPLAKISSLRTYSRCIRNMSEYGYLRYEPSKKKNRASKIYINE